MKRFIIASLAVLVPVFASADWRMIVRIKDGQTLAQVESTAQSLGGHVVDRTPHAPFALLSLPADPVTYLAAEYAIAAGIVDFMWAGDDVALWSAESISRGGQLSVISRGGQLSVISRGGQLSVISRGGQLSVIGTHAEYVTQNSSFMGQINWSESLANSDGRTVRLAILDTGLSRVQFPLWDKVDASYDVFGGDADDKPMNRDSNGNGTVDDGVGHGTMVAGIAEMVAPKVRFVVAKVADSDGKASAWGIMKGLDFAVDKGAEIANISLGSPDPVPAYAAMAEWCRTKGLLIVAGTGNDDYPQADYPAKDSLSLSVSGVAADDTKAWFGNYDLGVVSAAPAIDIIGRWWDGGAAMWSGTSFASPFVAASLADCLRRTAPKTGAALIAAAKASGRNADAVNLAAHKGKLGTVLDIVRLNGILSGTP